MKAYSTMLEEKCQITKEATSAAVGVQWGLSPYSLNWHWWVDFCCGPTCNPSLRSCRWRSQQNHQMIHTYCTLHKRQDNVPGFAWTCRSCWDQLPITPWNFPLTANGTVSTSTPNHSIVTIKPFTESHIPQAFQVIGCLSNIILKACHTWMDGCTFCYICFQEIAFHPRAILYNYLRLNASDFVTLFLPTYLDQVLMSFDMYVAGGLCAA